MTGPAATWWAEGIATSYEFARGLRNEGETVTATASRLISANLDDVWHFIEDDAAVVPPDAASFSMLQEQLSKVLDSLAERERKVISLRFGLEDGHPRTLEEVGREFGVTRERIRQIESKTLAKLRHPSRSSKLKDYLED